jgi:hypothetical protein
VKAIAGAIVILAGTVLWGTGVVAMSVPSGWNVGNTAATVGGIVGLIGFSVLVAGLLERPGPPRT